MSSPLLVNARFLLTATTGLQRVARELLLAARRQPLDFTTIAPGRPDAGDLTVDRVVPGPPGRMGDLVWEQVILPAATRGSLVLSPVNLAPLVGDNVVLVHDLAPQVGPQWFSRSGRLYGRIVVAAARRARGVLTVSDDVRGQLEGIGISRDRLHVVRPAVSSSLRRAPETAVEAVRRRHELTRPYVLMIGWADPRKDAATAIAAHALVDRPHDLVLVGRPHPAFAAVDAPLGPGVRRLGYVDDGELVALLTGAAALLYPSRYEGFGLPPLEAAACGVPAVVSDLPVLRESAGGVATFVPPGDVSLWAEAITAALDGELAAPAPPAWTWDDAAASLVDALTAVT